MPLATATVEFVPLRNDLANLPPSLTGMLFTANIPAQNAVVELELTSKPNAISGTQTTSVFLGWTGLSSTQDGKIEIDPTFASSLGISHGQKVTISVSTQAPLAHTIHLEPVTSGDWEIMETHVAFLETYMINQVRTVSIGQPVTVFPSPTALATLNVTNIEPPAARVARISPNSEVIVAPITKHNPNMTSDKQISSEQQQQNNTQPVGLIARSTVHPYLKDLDTLKLEVRGTLPLGYVSGQKVLVSLAIPPPVAASSSSTKGLGSADESEIPRAKVIYATYFRNSETIIGLSYGLSNALGLLGDSGIGAKIFVRPAPINKKFTSINAVLRPYVFNTVSKLASSKVESLSTEQINKLNLGLIGRGLVIPPVLPFLPNGGIIDTESKEWGNPGTMTWGSETPLAESKRMTHLDSVEETTGVVPKKVREVLRKPVVGVDSLIENLLNSLSVGSGTLLYGSRGCGKTVVINEVLNRLKSNHVRPLIFKCGAYTDKALSTVRDALKKISLEAQWVAPCTVVFDDLDKLIPASQEHSSDSMRRQQLAEVFAHIWEPLMQLGQVSILASSQDRTQVHSYLLTSHILDSTANLKPPDKELREKILKTALETSGHSTSTSLDLLEVVGETEGYQPGDLWTLVDRLSSIMALKQVNVESMKDLRGPSEKPPVVVTTEFILEAAAGFTPASLRGVKLERPNIKWSDVGGLKEAKRIVLETLEWPTKYAPVFANCPLRLRSGLLFYGYPGCGKTMLASAIASQTGLNFISVKGPEILNKYIGASEQSVRDLFDRAQAAKPCVLFFDEFDSIAPKRGHDATGVTDRVVNQLLTQMDGAEGLDGVYVLAATSRPDMIDSALLRPGRLDKSLLCDMPNTDDRYDILRRASHELNLSADVDLREVAKKVVGYSGADLQALIYNAYLTAVHKVLDDRTREQSENSGKTTAADYKVFHIGPGDTEAAKNYSLNAAAAASIKPQPISKEEDIIDDVDTVIITSSDMNKALLESKPSISPQELSRFRAIYSEFSTDRNGDMPPGTSSNEIGGRVTLQ